MSREKMICQVRARRERMGASQKSLAQMAGITRQALIAIEAGRQNPSTALSLRLAQILGCRVEDLFRLPDGSELRARLAPGKKGEPFSPLQEGARLALGRVSGRWVAHPLLPKAMGAAQALNQDAGSVEGQLIVRPLFLKSDLERNALVAGCAPLLGPLADRVGMGAGAKDAKVTWIPATSHRALDLLADELVHVAGLHLFDEGSGEDNLPFIRERFPDQQMVVVNLVRWLQGFVVAAGNPRGIRGAQDLLQKDLRVAWRDEGAGATKLIRRMLTAQGARARDRPKGPKVGGHVEVAQAIALGAADVGVAIESVALAQNLDFIPIAQERFDLVMRADVAEQDHVSRLIDVVAGRPFHREIENFAGYDAELSGQVITLDGKTGAAP
jgi:molybdate-binding protein/DNA-binding XRE family transcriptional regulator